MKKKTAFVLSGGGARGALQVGALRALFEAGIRPDILVGTSIGACNAAFLSINGFDQASLSRLENIWRDAAVSDLLPSSYLWLTVRAIFNRRLPDASHRMREFLMAHGLDPGLKFSDIPQLPLLVVSADLNNGRVCIYGNDPDQSILEGVLASTALPPWVAPLNRGEQLLIDGGVVSNLCLTAALDARVTEIYALDLETRNNTQGIPGFGPFLSKLLVTVQNRQIELEIALASEKKVPVYHVHLCENISVPIWDFSRTEELFKTGYEITRQELDIWLPKRGIKWFPAGLARLRQKLSKRSTDRQNVNPSGVQ